MNDALDQQRTAVGVVNAMTAEQISRSPDADAAQAVQRVSGVTVQDNKYIAVRGLGERYTTASLNGARVPSPEPEKRVVPLDMFPSGLLQSVTTLKTFTPDQQGDFAGALVDIQTREFPAQRSVTLQLTGGYAPGTSGARLLSARGVGGETFAMANEKRDLPALVRSVGNFQGINLNHADQNLLISQFRNAWTPTDAVARRIRRPRSRSAAMTPSSATRSAISSPARIRSATDLKDNQMRALADRGNTPGDNEARSTCSSGRRPARVCCGAGSTTLGTMIGDNSRLTFNGMYNRTADNDARQSNVATSRTKGSTRRSRACSTSQRAVHSAQLSGEHQLARRRLDWAVTSSGVQRDEPDRSEFVQAITHGGRRDRDAPLAEHRQRGRGAHVLDARTNEQ